MQLSGYPRAAQSALVRKGASEGRYEIHLGEGQEGYPPCNPTNFRDELRETLEKIEGVRQLIPHSCRHTYVSQMQALGVDLSTIHNIVGHADVDMTQHYLHVQDGIR